MTRFCCALLFVAFFITIVSALVGVSVFSLMQMVQIREDSCCLPADCGGSDVSAAAHKLTAGDFTSSSEICRLTPALASKLGCSRSFEALIQSGNNSRCATSSPDSCTNPSNAARTLSIVASVLGLLAGLSFLLLILFKVVRGTVSAVWLCGLIAAAAFICALVALNKKRLGDVLVEHAVVHGGAWQNTSVPRSSSSGFSAGSDAVVFTGCGSPILDGRQAVHVMVSAPSSTTLALMLVAALSALPVCIVVLQLMCCGAFDAVDVSRSPFLLVHALWKAKCDFEAADSELELLQVESTRRHRELRRERADDNFHDEAKKSQQQQQQDPPQHIDRLNQQLLPPTQQKGNHHQQQGPEDDPYAAVRRGSQSQFYHDYQDSLQDSNSVRGMSPVPNFSFASNTGGGGAVSQSEIFNALMRHSRARSDGSGSGDRKGSNSPIVIISPDRRSGSRHRPSAAASSAESTTTTTVKPVPVSGSLVPPEDSCASAAEKEKELYNRIHNPLDIEVRNNGAESPMHLFTDTETDYMSSGGGGGFDSDGMVSRQGSSILFARSATPSTTGAGGRAGGAPIIVVDRSTFLQWSQKQGGMNRGAAATATVDKKQQQDPALLSAQGSLEASTVSKSEPSRANVTAPPSPFVANPLPAFGEKQKNDDGGEAEQEYDPLDDL